MRFEMQRYKKGGIRDKGWEMGDRGWITPDLVFYH
jgi:hypothetical protein